MREIIIYIFILFILLGCGVDSNAPSTSNSENANNQPVTYPTEPTVVNNLEEADDTANGTLLVNTDSPYGNITLVATAVLPTCVLNNKSCGFSYSGGYGTKELRCGITYYAPNTSFHEREYQTYYTNCSSCRQAVFRFNNSILSFESPIYKVARLRFIGMPRYIDAQYQTKHGFKIRTLDGSTCQEVDKYFSYDLNQVYLR